MTEQSGWQLTGSGPEAYERFIVPAWMGDWAQALIKAGHVGLGKRVLDVGCGTGIVARKAAPFVGSCGKITGIDINEGMVRWAKYFAEKEGIFSIEWRQGDAVSIPFSEGTYDVVLCQQGLQFCMDPLAALREMARVMVPGGRIAISAWRELERYPCFRGFANVLESFLGKESTVPFHTSCSLADREKLRDLMNDAGFHNIHIRLEVKMARYPLLEEFISGYLAATPLAAEVSGMKKQKRLEMFRHIITSLRDYVDDDGLAAPMECHVVTANK